MHSERLGNMMAAQGGYNIVAREYRKGNWTVNETMVLIEAKEMDYERRMKRSGENDQARGNNKPTELRWKWVEDYCWKKGCLRSQNQCNDKWDNLMRDYKKVREFQRKEGQQGSYWEMEKNERKEKNLPSNMLRHVYERLVEVVENKGGHTVAVATPAGCGGGGGESESDPNVPNLPYLMPMPSTTLPTILAAIPLPLPPPPQPPQVPPSTTAPPPPPAPLIPPPLSYNQPLPTVDSDTSEYSDSPAKRRRKRGGGNGDNQTDTNEVGTAISKSASIIAEAIQASEEREERRHRDLISFHERRLKIEESKSEINKKGIDGLVDAINKLSNSILALANTHKNQSSSAP